MDMLEDEVRPSPSGMEEQCILECINADCYLLHSQIEFEFGNELQIMESYAHQKRCNNFESIRTRN